MAALRSLGKLAAGHRLKSGLLLPVTWPAALLTLAALSRARAAAP